MTQQLIRQSFPVRTPDEILRTIASQVGRDSRSIFDAAAVAHKAVFQSPGRAPVVHRTPAPKPITLEEQLYDVRAAFKLRTNMVAMHFGADWQKKFFQQLDFSSMPKNGTMTILSLPRPLSRRCCGFS